MGAKDRTLIFVWTDGRMGLSLVNSPCHCQTTCRHNAPILAHDNRTFDLHMLYLQYTQRLRLSAQTLHPRLQRLLATAVDCSSQRSSAWLRAPTGLMTMFQLVCVICNLQFREWCPLFDNKRGLSPKINTICCTPSGICTDSTRAV